MFEPHYVDGACVWVDVSLPDGRRRRLQGHDVYWWKWPDYGCYNTDPGYEGKPAASWRWTDDGEVDTEGRTPPPGFRSVRGGWVSDERARQIGLL